jgi:hypothetical protein
MLHVGYADYKQVDLSWTTAINSSRLQDLHPED